MHTPRTPHLDAINRIFRYLKGTLRKRICMRKIILMIYVAISMQIGLEILIENRQSDFAYL
jgi:hypothetical protein